MDMVDLIENSMESLPLVYVTFAVVVQKRRTTQMTTTI